MTPTWRLSFEPEAGTFGIGDLSVQIVVENDQKMTPPQVEHLGGFAVAPEPVDRRFPAGGAEILHEADAPFVDAGIRPGQVHQHPGIRRVELHFPDRPPAILGTEVSYGLLKLHHHELDIRCDPFASEVSLGEEFHRDQKETEAQSRIAPAQSQIFASLPVVDGSSGPGAGSSFLFMAGATPIKTNPGRSGKKIPFLPPRFPFRVRE